MEGRAGLEIAAMPPAHYSVHGNGQIVIIDKKDCAFRRSAVPRGARALIQELGPATPPTFPHTPRCRAFCGTSRKVSESSHLQRKMLEMKQDRKEEAEYAIPSKPDPIANRTDWFWRNAHY